jgi:DNA-binding GntR family transcriptional regulator
MTSSPSFTIPIAKRTRLSDHIMETLSKMILDGILEPGTVIRTEELGRQLGVSRTPMREALQRLESDGFVTIAPNGVASVASLDSNDALQMMDIREVIDGLVARLLAERGLSDTTLAEFQDMVQRMQRASAADDKHGYLVVNARFHAAMLTATEHKPLQQFHSLVRITSQAVYMGQGHQPVRHRESGEEHHRILDAIRRRKPAEAEALARAHIRSAAEFWLRQRHQETRERAAGG